MGSKHELLLLVAFMLIGCGRSGSDNPVAPAGPHGVSDQAAPAAAANRYVWGVWKVRIDAEGLSAEIIPQRVSEMHFNIVRLLEQTACTDCLSIGNVHLLPNGDLTVDVTLKHPFPTMVRYTGFDVRGILIGNSDYTFPLSGRMVAWGDDRLRLLNADGYTALFNPTEYPETPDVPALLRYFPGKWKVGSGFTATLNPYLAYSEDQPRRIFAAGSMQTRTYLLHVPSGPIKFGYAVDACWTPVENVVDPVTDFPPDANCLEAYRIKVDVGAGLLPEAGSSVPIQVELWDHQGHGTVSSVTIEGPELFTGEVPLSFSTVTGEESYLFDGTLPNELGAYIGRYPLLVRVSDTEADPNLGFIDAWQVATVKVGPKAGWARTWGGTYGEEAKSIAVDDEGNVFVAGSFGGVVDFDPGPGVEEHSGDIFSLFVSKFDEEGVFLWVRVWGPLSNGPPYGIAVDSEGDLYLTGRFGGTVDFDPGPGVYELTSVDEGDPFLCNVDSNGDFQWALRWGDEVQGPESRAITTDNLGCVYIAGMYAAYNVPVDFDPGPGEDFHTEEKGSFFVSKFDSAGQYQWARTWGGADLARINSIACGSGQALYVGGLFGGNIDFDPGPGEDFRWTWEDGNLFLSKFKTNGDYQWVRTWGIRDYIPGGDLTHLFDVAVDSSADILVTGEFDDKVDFDPGDEVAERRPVGNADAFLSRFGPDGDFQWVQTWGGDHIDPGQSVAVDDDGNIFVTGFFYFTVDFDPGPGVETCTALGYEDPYLLKLYPSGDFNWVRIWGAIYHEKGREVAVDNAGNAFVTGEYYGSVDFDPGPDEDIHTCNSSFDVFLSKFPPDGNW